MLEFESISKTVGKGVVRKHFYLSLKQCDFSSDKENICLKAQVRPEVQL